MVLNAPSRRILPFATQLIFFLTPVAYPIAMVPAGWRLIYCLNPLVAAIECPRSAIFGTPLGASVSELATSLGAGLAVFLTGLWFFNYREPVLADVGES